MRGNDKVRHCGTCRTNVYNISAMSEEEAERIVGRDDVCVRYFHRSDGTIVRSDCELASRRPPARLAAGLSAALAYPVAFGGIMAAVGDAETASHVIVDEASGVKLAMGIKLHIRSPQESRESDLELLSDALPSLRGQENPSSAYPSSVLIVGRRSSKLMRLLRLLRHHVEFANTLQEARETSYRLVVVDELEHAAARKRFEGALLMPADGDTMTMLRAVESLLIKEAPLLQETKRKTFERLRARVRSLFLFLR